MVSVLTISRKFRKNHQEVSIANNLVTFGSSAGITNDFDSVCNVAAYRSRRTCFLS